MQQLSLQSHPLAAQGALNPSASLGLGLGAGAASHTSAAVAAAVSSGLSASSSLNSLPDSVDDANNTTVFVGNLDSTVTVDQLRR